MTHYERLARRENIITDLKAGLSIREITIRHNVSCSWVEKIAHNNGITIITQARQERKARDAEIINALKAGANSREIAKKFGLSPSRVRDIAASSGAILPNKINCSSFKILAALWNPNRTMKDIAAEFRITTQYVSYIYNRAKEAGIPIPERKRP